MSKITLHNVPTLTADNLSLFFTAFELPETPEERLAVLRRLEEIISELRYQLELEVARQAE